MGIYHFSVNTVLSTVNIVIKATGEVIDTLHQQSEKAVLALRSEYPDCSIIVDTEENSRVLARCREFPNSPSMSLNYKDFGVDVKQHSTFLLEADHLESVITTSKSGGEYSEIVPFGSNDKEWDGVKIHSVELPSKSGGDNRSRLAEGARRNRLG